MQNPLKQTGQRASGLCLSRSPDGKHPLSNSAHLEGAQPCHSGSEVSRCQADTDKSRDVDIVSDRICQSNIKEVARQQIWFKLAPLFCCLTSQQRQSFAFGSPHSSIHPFIPHRLPSHAETPAACTNPDLHTENREVGPKLRVLTQPR